jgi:PEP-CTERM motif
MIRLLLLTTAALIALAAPASAGFVQLTVEPGDELKMFNDGANKNAAFFFGSTHGNGDAQDVRIFGDVNVNTGNGFAAITPANGALTHLTFEPQGANAYDAFFTGGQLAYNGALKGKDKPKDGFVHITVNGVQTFDYSEKLSGDFGPIGFEWDGVGDSTISSVLMWTDGDYSFKSVKQVDWSAANPVGSVGAVPEPSTWAMLGIGFAGLGFAGWKRSRKDRLAASI